MRKLFLALLLTPTVALANPAQVKSLNKATCYGYLLVHRAAYPEDFKKIEALVKADEEAKKHIVKQHQMFTSFRADIYKPMAVHNCQQFDIKIR